MLEVDGGIKVDNIAAAASGRRRHLRRRLGDLRQARLQGRDRRDARASWPGRVNAPARLFAAIRAAIIDLDGTMLDTAPDFQVAHQRMRAELGLAPISHRRHRAASSARAPRT